MELGYFMGCLIGWFVNIVIGYYIGNIRRRPGLGVVLAMLLGPLGWLIVAVLPTAESPEEPAHAVRRPNQRYKDGFVPCPLCGQGINKSTLQQGINTCPWCGGEFRAQ